ncbi:MAG: outer membrane beta-barrel protein [Bacteroidales bacterium]|nr:outer membrane beta-barrel protein [Bacteroidales bacterium]
MKYRRFLLFLVLTAVCTVGAHAQAFKAELISGFNISQVDGDETAGFKKYGLNTGVGVVLPVYKNWSLSFETLYSQKGSRLRKQYNDSLDGSYRLFLNYAEVPFMIQYTDKNFMSAGAGVSWGRLVHVQEWKNGYRVDSVTLLNGPFSKDDFQLFGDFRFRIYKNLKVNARYAYSFKKLATRVVRDSQSGMLNKRYFYNNLWTIRLIYTFNESSTVKKNKNVPEK